MTKESSSGLTTTAVQVALRIRPLTERDRAQPRFANLANDDVLKIHENTVQVVPQNKLFTFDHVFGTNSTQDEIFSAIGEKLIRKFVEGYNITILAYGQTSSGKTYTMGTAAMDNGMNKKDEGIVPRSMALLFDLLHNTNNTNNTSNNDPRPISPTSSVSSSTTASTKSGSRLRPISKIANRSSHIPQVPNSSNNNPHKTKFTVKVSFIEIYNEDLHDLLNSAPLEELPPITIREDTKGRIYWTGVKEVLVHSTDDVLYYLEQGTQNRATGSTDMNEKSSRSHAIFSVSLKQEKWIPSTSTSTEKPKRPTSSMSTRSSITPNTSSRLFNAAATAQDDNGEWLITTSKFHFVDLAGSERLKRTAAEGDRRKEGININAGLLALGNVISALGDPSKKNKIHVPYRDSKLTRLLQDSLGGSATTLMIACASPVEYNLAETLNTLQYANRARNIKNRSEKNQVEEWMTTENIELLRSMIGKLKQELNYIKANGSPTTTASLKDDEDAEEDPEYHDQRMLISDLQRQVEELDGEASVTRERNRMVEKELQRVRLLESMMQQAKEEEQVDFQHLVEPVIEEYEKSISKLESQLALTRAALTHSDMGYEEQQNKLTQLETLIRSQEQTISELRLRLGKVLEREQSNEGYIHELETKLMKSAQETTKDQEMLNELKNRIMKLKETDENTEQYIHDLEQRLASGDAERTRLRTQVEDLEAKIEAKERTNVELLRRLSKTTSNNSTEKLILKELDEVNAKYANLEKEREALQEQVKTLQKENHRISTSSTLTDTIGRNMDLTNATLGEELKSKSGLSSSSPPKFKNRKSFADETETANSVAALSLIQAETRAKEEAERAKHLQLTLDRLQYDHQETLKELDEVLQRYHETLEQLDFLERESSSTTAHDEDMMVMPKSLDLSKEIAQAKEDAHEQEKQAFVTQIASLQEALSKQKLDSNSEMSSRIQKLEHELSVANKQIYILKQMESEHNAAAEVEKILENLDAPSTPTMTEKKREDPNKDLLELERKHTKHWKTAHSELKQDMEKMALDLDEKEQYIVQLKQQMDDGTIRQGELQISLDEAHQEVIVLQKRLAETQGSLTVLKLNHADLQKRQAAASSSPPTATVAVAKDADLVAKHSQEKELLLNTYQAELAKLQQTMDGMDQVLKNTNLDKETALQKIAAFETQLKEQTEQAQNNNYLEQEKMVQEHEQRLSVLRKEYELEWNDLKEKLTTLETELEVSKNIHEETLSIHNQRLREASTEHFATVHELEDEIHSLETEVIKYQDSLKEAQAEHVQQMSVLESELNELKTLHAERLQKLNEQHQAELESLKSELTNAHNGELQQVGLQHNDKVSALKKNLDELKNTHAEELQKLVIDHQAALDAINSTSDTSLRQVNSQHSEAAQQIAALQQQVDQLKASHVEELQKLVLEHKSALAVVQSENDRLVSSHDTNLRDINSQYNEATQQLSLLQSEINSLKKAHADQLQTLMSEHQAALEALQSENVKLSSSQSNLQEVNLQHNEASQQQSAALKLELEKLEQAHAEELEKLEAEHQSTLEALQMENERLLASTNDTLKEYDEAAEQMNALQVELDRLKSVHAQELENMKSEHQQLSSSHQDQSTQQLNVLQAELDLLKSIHAEQLEKSTLEHGQELQAMKTDNNDLQSQLNHVKEQVATLEIQLAAAKSGESTAQEQLTQLQQKHIGLTEKMVSLESKLVTAKVDHVAVVQAHQAQLAETLSQHEKAISTLTSTHAAQHVETVSLFESKHETTKADFTKQLNQAHDIHQAQLEELTQDLDLLRTTHAEKEDMIVQQRQTMEKHLAKINHLSEEITKLQFAANLNQQADDSTGQQKLYEERISQLEQQLKQLREENVEYTGLAEELEREINRMTIEKDALADELDTNEEAYQQKMNDIKSILGVMSDDQVIAKLKGCVQPRSTTAPIMSSVDASAAADKKQGDQSSVNNNDISSRNKKDGSGALTQQPGPSTPNGNVNYNTAELTIANAAITATKKQLQQANEREARLQKDLEDLQNQFKEMVPRDKLISLEKQLTQQQQKLEKSEKMIKKLEKQLDELLKKKSGFMCF